MEPEYIERKALDKALTAAAAHDKDKNRRTWAKAICVLHDLHAADVAPVSELLTLRDALYENDQITMRGLARLNMLIAKYGGYDHG